MRPISVSYKPSTLGYSDLFQLGAAVRYPRSTRPVTTWIVRESLFITLSGGLLCILAVYFAYPMSSPVRLASRVVPILLFSWSLYLALRTWWSYQAHRIADVVTVELSEDGVSYRNRDTEWRTRWKPTFEIAVTPRFVLINCGRGATAGIPRESFASFVEEGEFVRVGRLFQAAATGKATLEVEERTSEEWRTP
jgi:hypothetical protein